REAIEQRKVFLTTGSRYERAVLEEDGDVDRRLLVEGGSKCAGIFAVHHPGPVGGGHEGTVAAQPRDVLDSRLSMIRAEDDGIPLEELVAAAGRFEQGCNRRVRTVERIVRGIRPERVRRVVVIRQV